MTQRMIKLVYWQPFACSLCFGLWQEKYFATATLNKTIVWKLRNICGVMVVGWNTTYSQVTVTYAFWSPSQCTWVTFCGKMNLQSIRSTSQHGLLHGGVLFLRSYLVYGERIYGKMNGPTTQSIFFSVYSSKPICIAICMYFSLTLDSFANQRTHTDGQTWHFCPALKRVHHTSTRLLIIW